MTKTARTIAAIVVSAAPQNATQPPPERAPLATEEKFLFKGMKFGDKPQRWMADHNPPQPVKEAGIEVMYGPQIQIPQVGNLAAERELFIYKNKKLVAIEYLSRPFAKIEEANSFCLLMTSNLQSWKEELTGRWIRGEGALASFTAFWGDARIEVKARRRAGYIEMYEVAATFSQIPRGQ